MAERGAQIAAAEIMAQFAVRTGLISGRSPRRYLWTDAFAVCNWLGLYEQLGESDYLDLALRLVDQVHRVLGKHREDDPRRGWVSGLEEERGQRHPTAGGLRIGKTLNERSAHELYDPALEWERDGQYFHYLTKWMHALCRVSRVSEETRYRQWAAELAEAVHSAFTYRPRPGSPPRMYWKVSIDLSRPLVTSMGQHDPLDGLIAYWEINATADRRLLEGDELDLSDQIDEMTAICLDMDWSTQDPLGVGGLLSDAYRVAQLISMGAAVREGMLVDLMEASLVSLRSFLRSAALDAPPAHRLAFRELGLAVGLRALEPMRALLAQVPEAFEHREALEALISELVHHIPLAEEIVAFWRDPGRQESEAWRAHQDINAVMLATCLTPEGFLRI